MRVTTKQTDLTLIGCRYVEGVVSYYYHGNDDVIRDTELQGWINEIIVFGRLGDEQKGRTSCDTSTFLQYYYCSTSVQAIVLQYFKYRLQQLYGESTAVSHSKVETLMSNLKLYVKQILHFKIKAERLKSISK